MRSQYLLHHHYQTFGFKKSQKTLLFCVLFGAFKLPLDGDKCQEGEWKFPCNGCSKRISHGPNAKIKYGATD